MFMLKFLTFSQSLLRKITKQVTKWKKGQATFTTTQRGGNQNLKHKIYCLKYSAFNKKNTRHAKK